MVMIPNTKVTAEKTCKYCEPFQYSEDYDVYNMPYVCKLDVNHRYCKGKCQFYIEKNLLDKHKYKIPYFLFLLFLIFIFYKMSH